MTNAELRKELGRMTTPVTGGMEVDRGSQEMYSYIGHITHALPGESWPVAADGSPMSPLAQLYLGEIQAPEIIADLALITVFIDSEGGQGLRNGEGWVLRTYRNLDGLVRITGQAPKGRLAAKRLRWGAPTVDMPVSPDYAPARYEKELDRYFDEVETDKRCSRALKVGGYPHHLQWSVDFCETKPNEEDIKEFGFSIVDIRLPNPAKPAFAFQIASMHELEFYHGDMGILYFGRGTGGHAEEWFLDGAGH